MKRQISCHKIRRHPVLANRHSRTKGRWCAVLRIPVHATIPIYAGWGRVPGELQLARHTLVVLGEGRLGLSEPAFHDPVAEQKLQFATKNEDRVVGAVNIGTQKLEVEAIRSG